MQRKRIKRLAKITGSIDDCQWEAHVYDTDEPQHSIWFGPYAYRVAIHQETQSRPVVTMPCKGKKKRKVRR